jgi:hypothetical protein
MSGSNPDLGSNRVPTVDELRQAAALLHIPVDEHGMRLAERSPSRQVTLLLALMEAWLTAFQYAHDLTVDPLSADELAALVIAAVGAVVQGDGAAAANMAIWHVQSAGFIARNLGSTHPNDTRNPAAAVDALLRAATRILAGWRNTTAQPEVTVGGLGYAVGDPEQARLAAQDTRHALAAITALIGPAPNGAQS